MKKIIFALIFCLISVPVWAIPPSPPGSGGTGDMTKAVYDADDDGVVDAGAIPDLSATYQTLLTNPVTGTGTQYYLTVWGASGVGALAALGSSGSLLKSAGAGANPAWTTETFDAPGAQYALLHSNGTNWTRLATSANVTTFLQQADFANMRSTLGVTASTSEAVYTMPVINTPLCETSGVSPGAIGGCTNLADTAYGPLAGTNAWTGAQTLSKVNAASGSIDVATFSGTLGIFNGSDTFRGVYFNYTNADHTGTGNTVAIIDIAALTGDAHSNLHAIRIGSLTGTTGAASEVEQAITIGAGWDYGIKSASPIEGSSLGTPQPAATMGDAWTLRGYGTNGRGVILRTNGAEPANSYYLDFDPATEPTAGMMPVAGTVTDHAVPFTWTASTGTGAPVRANTPTLTTPVIGAATGTSLALSGNLTGLAPPVVLTIASGVHDGADDAATMTDSGESFTTSQFVGMTVYNITDGSSCTVTANNATTITCTLAGGTQNDWDTNDVWQVGPGPLQSGAWFYVVAASTIRHPATAGYLVCYESDAAAVLTIDMASDSMIFQGTLDTAVVALDAGDSIDSSGSTTGDYMCIHNKSATEAQGKGKRGTWVDGGAT